MVSFRYVLLCRIFFILRKFQDTAIFRPFHEGLVRKRDAEVNSLKLIPPEICLSLIGDKNARFLVPIIKLYFWPQPVSVLVRKPDCRYVVDCVLFEDGFSLNGTIGKRYPNRNVFELAHQRVRYSKIYCFEYLRNVFFSAFCFPFPFHIEKASLKHIPNVSTSKVFVTAFCLFLYFA